MLYKHIIILFFSSLIFLGCGGADPIEDDKVSTGIVNPLSDQEAPRFITFDSVEHPENESSIIQIQAQDDNQIIYTITGGFDAHLFELDKNLGLLTFRNTPNFEEPIDQTKDNIYNLTIKAEDENNNETFQSLLVVVIDVDENI